jgi:hypothetical protein
MHAPFLARGLDGRAAGRRQRKSDLLVGRTSRRARPCSPAGSVESGSSSRSCATSRGSGRTFSRLTNRSGRSPSVTSDRRPHGVDGELDGDVDHRPVTGGSCTSGSKSARKTTPASSAPAIGATQKSHSCCTAQPPPGSWCERPRPRHPRRPGRHVRRPEDRWRRSSAWACVASAISDDSTSAAARGRRAAPGAAASPRAPGPAARVAAAGASPAARR